MDSLSKSFMIKSCIHQAYSNPSVMALGYFVIYIKDMRYGVFEEDATSLACSYDSIKERFLMRGQHIIPPLVANASALDIAEAVRSSIYDDKSDEFFFGMSASAFSDLVYGNKLLMAPDGDEAFDDRSYILQFDICDEVRLVAYKCNDENRVDYNTLRDTRLSSDKFYSTLEQWLIAFTNEWKLAVKK